LRVFNLLSIETQRPPGDFRSRLLYAYIQHFDEIKTQLAHASGGARAVTD